MTFLIYPRTSGYRRQAPANPDRPGTREYRHNFQPPGADSRHLFRISHVAFQFFRLSVPLLKQPPGPWKYRYIFQPPGSVDTGACIAERLHNPDFDPAARPRPVVRLFIPFSASWPRWVPGPRDLVMVQTGAKASGWGHGRKSNQTPRAPCPCFSHRLARLLFPQLNLAARPQRRKPPVRGYIRKTITNTPR